MLDQNGIAWYHKCEEARTTYGNGIIGILHTNTQLFHNQLVWMKQSTAQDYGCKK
jgi:hypothetical protein